MNTRLATSLIALTTAIAAPAMADVTPADVLSNQQAFYGAMGVTLSGDLSDGVISGAELNMVFPEGVAGMQISTTADVTLAEQNDGSVLISYPSPMDLTVSGGADGEGSFSLDMTLSHDGYTVIASGNPGDITYVADAQNLRFEINGAQVDDPTAGDVDMEGEFTMESWAGTSNVTEGNVISYTSTSEVGVSMADFTFMVDSVVSNSGQNTLPVQSNVTLLLPVGGSNLMNLSSALRDGLSINIESQGGGSTSTAETTVGGDVLNSQVTSTGPQVATVIFDENGMVLNAQATDFDVTFNDRNLFPGDVEFAMDDLSMNYDVPVNASDEPQDFRVATSLKGLTLGDTIWSMIDPAGMLPRDPAEISFDVTGNGSNGTDLLDFAAMAQMFGPPAIEVDDITIENLRIAAVGAEATATGAMTFDWTDFQTIPGIARPEGKVTVNLNGANALMDTLVSMGLIPEQELMMPRMMMGMFATPVGDDMLETVLEVNSEGHVLANGQRLQ